ncbi:MAG: immunoglobulin-like domain-containing protein [Candidatus Paceibacterota bacterium]|jgi:hypothetical protein
MKKGILFILVVVLFCSFYSKVSANELCSPRGYTISAVNGIFTNEEGARNNQRLLKVLLKDTYKNQKLDYQYLYNPSHLAGAGDLFDAVGQGLFNQKNDYDLVEMLNDASKKVTTQKVLLVAHSQGNFYANNFYDKVASQPGGVPERSIGAYGVATPANRVAGGGKYLTSSTDAVINKTRLLGILDVLKANTDINLQEEVGSNGHGFSDIYLKYQGDKIVSDIRSSLDKLKENDEQEIQEPCISAPELTFVHKMQGVALAVADPTAVVVKNGVVGTYGVGVYIANGVQNVGIAIGNFFHNTGLAIGNSFNNLSANVAGSLPDTRNLVAILPNVVDSVADNPQDNNLPPEQIPENTTETAPPSVDEGTQAIPVEVPQETEIIPPQNQNTVLEEGGNSSGGVGGVGGSRGDGGGSPISPAELPPASIPVPDIIPPIISLVDSSPIDIIKDTVYVDAGATALDDIDGMREVTSSGTVDIATIGTYIITYSATDLSGNIGTLTRTVNVIAPPPPPPPPLATFTIDKDTTLAAGEYNYDNLVITNNAVLTLEGDSLSTNAFKGVKINAINIIIDVGASISADQKGYGPGSGQGTSSGDSTGASYGGYSVAGDTNSTIYGSATKPTDLGSGGNSYGGGAVHIVVSETFTDNGIISADGNTSSSGGSIYITTKNMTGSGVMHANGGGLFASGYFKSPGGGGRIALYYQTSSFDGKIEAKGGCGQYDGMTMTCAENGTIGIFDESSNDLYVNNSWRFQKNDSPLNFNNINISNGAKVSSEDGANVKAKNILINGTSIFTLSGGETINADVLTLSGNSIITVIPEKILSLAVLNLNIENGSSISADAKGYINGPGTPATQSEAGASYGGMGGGATAKPIYGSDLMPVDFGSGTEGRRGGGAIRINVTDTFINDGIVSANGYPVRTSGGSIYVTTNKINGSGTFQTKGGDSSWPYGPIGGSGGRIAIHYYTSSFSGATNVLGGVYCFSGCAPAAEVGTVKMIDESIPPPPPPPPPPDPVPDPVPDATVPTITNYTLNGVADNLTINPLVNPVTLVFTANKNVDWVSVKIENETDATLHKLFYSGSGCVDGTDTCTKNWDGILSGGGLLQNGIFKIKVRIKDLISGTQYDFVSPYLITVDTTI